MRVDIQSYPNFTLALGKRVPCFASESQVPTLKRPVADKSEVETHSDSPVRKVLFMGSKRLGLLCLEVIYRSNPSILQGVMTIDDRTDRRSTLDGFKRFCCKEDIPVFIARNRKNAETLISELRPEFCIVVGWYWLISKETLQVVPRGMIGLHTSLLPSYRGGSPLVWAMLNQETKVGVSLFTLTENMDDGDIWGQAAVPVASEDTIQTVLDRLEKAAVVLVRERYPCILEGTATPQPQDHSKATYCALRTPRDGWIDWSRPARFVYDFIRAQTDPYPGAYTLYQGRKLSIWKASLLPEVYFGTPGQVARILEQKVAVVCGDNRAVLLEIVESESSREPAGRVLRSLKIRFPVYTPPLLVLENQRQRS